MVRKILFRVVGVKTIATVGEVKLNSEYSEDSCGFIAKEWGKVGWSWWIKNY